MADQTDSNRSLCVLTVDLCGTDEGEVLMQYAVPTPEFGLALMDMIKTKYADSIQGVQCGFISDLKDLGSLQSVFEKISSDIDETL